MQKDPPNQIARQKAFHARPLCTAAIGALLGTAFVRVLAPPTCYIAAVLALAVCASAYLCARRNVALLCLSLSAALVLAGLRYPSGGTFPYYGPVTALPETGFFGALPGLREAIGKRILQLFPQNGGVAVGMLLGQKGAISDHTISAFQDVGVMHLLAISGLHVSVLAGAFQLLFRRNPWVRFAAVTLFLAAYAMLTALSPSVVRASILLLCSILARPLLRRPDPPTNLALAFLVILLFNPLALFYTGFQLSFTAVYGLILLKPCLERPFHRLGSTASGVIGGTLAVTVSTLPIMARAFGRVQLASVLANLFILPIVPFFLIPAFLCVALSYLLPPLALPFAVVARLALNVIVAFSEAGGAVDVSIAAPNAVASLFYLAALPFLSPLCLLPKERSRTCFLAVMCAALIVWGAGTI